MSIWILVAVISLIVVPNILFVSSQSTDNTARCFNPIVNSDVNADNVLNLTEFIAFRQEFCSIRADNDNIEFATNTFYSVACNCATEINADPMCCSVANAKVDVDGVRDVVHDNTTAIASVESLEFICTFVRASCDYKANTVDSSGSDTPSQSPVADTSSIAISDVPSTVPITTQSGAPSITALSDRPSLVPSIVPITLSEEPIAFPTPAPQFVVPSPTFDSPTTNDVPSPVISEANFGCARNNSFPFSFIVGAVTLLLGLVY